jgi:Flp pilus assembly protein protease CpaA
VWTLALKILIFALLACGAYFDLKYRTVSNKITLSIIILSLPLISWNWHNITIFHILAGASILGLYFIIPQGIGGADVKSVVPIIFTLNIFEFLILLFLVATMNLALLGKYKTKAPFFVALASGYFFITTFSFLQVLS